MARLSPLRVLATAASLLASLNLAVAQVSTACQPLNTTGCPADPAFGADNLFNFNVTPSTSFWETTAGSVAYSSENGAQFTINKQGDSPTIRSTFYIFFGRTEMLIKAASGTGVISSVMFLSDDLDEIDWEFMGGNTSYVETNYFGKGRQDYKNAIYYPVDNGIIDDFHNYTTVWTNTSLDYYIDGSKVRSLLPADANSTNNYPQTPMRISLGIWAGGDPTLPEGTREWAGGDTNYTEGPFNMYVKSAQVTDYSTGKEYTYGDHTGSWDSIEITAGNSTAKTALTAKSSTSESLSDKWKNLSSTAKIAIYASGAGVGALIVAVGLYYCIKQRRRGREENRLYEERLAQERLELEQFQKSGINPDSLAASGSEYHANEMNKDGLASSNAYNIPPQTPDSIAEEKERAWGAAGFGVGAAASAAMRSPAASNDRGMYNNSPMHHDGGLNAQQMQSPRAGSVSPVSPVSPAFPQNGPYGGYNNPPAGRSFTAPNAQMRGSPGPADLGMGMQRTQSPAFVAPVPQRSYTANSLRNMNTSPAPAYHAPSFGNSNSNTPQSFNGYGNASGNSGQSYGAPGSHGSGFDNNYWR